MSKTLTVGWAGTLNDAISLWMVPAVADMVRAYRDDADCCLQCRVPPHEKHDGDCVINGLVVAIDAVRLYGNASIERESAVDYSRMRHTHLDSVTCVEAGMAGHPPHVSGGRA